MTNGHAHEDARAEAHPATTPLPQRPRPRYPHCNTHPGRLTVPHTIENANEPLPAFLTSAVVCAAALSGFKPYLLSEKSAPVAELFPNSYGLLATKASTQLRTIESNVAFVPGSNPLWKWAVGAALVAARPSFTLGPSNSSFSRPALRYGGGNPGSSRRAALVEAP